MAELELHQWMFDEKITLLDYRIKEVTEELLQRIDAIICTNCKVSLKVIKSEDKAWIEFCFNVPFCPKHRKNNYETASFLAGLQNGLSNIGEVFSIASHEFSRG